MTLGELLASGGRAALDRLADAGSMIRYGVPFDQKARMALTGEIPGYRQENLASELGADIEQRRAAAFLFGRQYPDFAPSLQDIVDRLRAGDDPRILAVTRDAVRRGAQEAERTRAAQPRMPEWMLEAK